MSANTTSPTQASDEITDAALDKISGGRGLTDYDQSMSGRQRPTGGNSNPGRHEPKPPQRPQNNGTLNQIPRR